MAMKKIEDSNLTTLKQSVESVRKIKYPDLPGDLLARIIDIQSEHQEDPSASQKEIKKEILSYLNNI